MRYSYIRAKYQLLETDLAAARKLLPKMTEDDRKVAAKRIKKLERELRGLQKRILEWTR